MKSIFRDIKNFFIIKKALKKWNNTHTWNKFDLVKGWFINFGCVVTLKKEYFGEDETMKKTRTIETLRPVFDFISNEMQIGDLVHPEIKYIEGSYSYLVKFHQIYDAFSLKLIFKYIFFIILISIIIKNYDNIYIFLKEIIKWIK